MSPPMVEMETSSSCSLVAGVSSESMDDLTPHHHTSSQSIHQVGLREDDYL